MGLPGVTARTPRRSPGRAESFCHHQDRCPDLAGRQELASLDEDGPNPCGRGRITVPSRNCPGSRGDKIKIRRRKKKWQKKRPSMEQPRKCKWSTSGIREIQIKTTRPFHTHQTGKNEKSGKALARTRSTGDAPPCRRGLELAQTPREAAW